MDRREFLRIIASASGLSLLWGCGREETNPADLSNASSLSALGEVTLYDTHAMSLYMDGGLGPKTGIIKVDYILANQPVTMKFWHGHGGADHAFTVTPEHFKELKKLKRVYLETTVVEGHKHRMFIDPVDPKYRVAGAKPVIVPTESFSA